MTHASRNTKTGLVWEEKCHAKKEGIDLTKYNLYRYLDNKGINWRDIISKRLLPDEAYLVGDELKIYEKKFQSTQGSADEKIQTCAFKIFQYRKIAKVIGAKIVSFTYLLNDWFNKPEYKDVLEYIDSVEGCSYIIYNEGDLNGAK